jgi:trigger factor
MDNFYTKKEVNEYTYEFTITIPKDNFSKSYDLVLKDYAKKIEVKGFRKGNVPSDLISEQVKEVCRFETLEKLAPMYINTALQKENLQPIAPPEYKEIPKILEALDVSFTVTVTVMPQFNLGDLKKITVEKEDINISKEEIDNTLEELKKSQKTTTKEINDAWAKEIGKLIDQKDVTTLKQLREKVKDLLQKQKERFQLHQMQEKVLKLAIKESNINIPQPAIKFEAQERERAFNKDMTEKNINVEEFLKTNNLTIEKMRELWEKDSEEAIQTDVFLSLYAEKEDIKVTDEELNKKIEDIKKQRPDADPKVFSDSQWKEYIKNVERKEKAFKSLIQEILGKDFLDINK